MRTVISRAKEVGHPALSGLKDALANGKSEDYLRRMGVIHTRDLEREFKKP